MSGLPPALVVVADDPAQGLEPGERDGRRPMSELAALGKGQVLLCPGFQFPPSLCFLRSSSHLAEERADPAGRLEADSGTLCPPSSRLPLVSHTSPSPTLCCCECFCDHSSFWVGDLNWPFRFCHIISICIFLSLFSLVPDTCPPRGGSTLALTQGRRWRPAGAWDGECEGTGRDNWHCHPSRKAWQGRWFWGDRSELERKINFAVCAGQTATCSAVTPPRATADLAQTGPQASHRQLLNQKMPAASLLSPGWDTGQKAASWQSSRELGPGRKTFLRRGGWTPPPPPPESICCAGTARAQPHAHPQHSANARNSKTASRALWFTWQINVCSRCWFFLIKKIYSDWCRINERSKRKLKASEEFQSSLLNIIYLLRNLFSSLIDLWQTKSWADSNFQLPSSSQDS